MEEVDFSHQADLFRSFFLLRKPISGDDCLLRIFCIDAHSILSAFLFLI